MSQSVNSRASKASRVSRASRASQRSALSVLSDKARKLDFKPLPVSQALSASKGGVVVTIPRPLVALTPKRVPTIKKPSTCSPVLLEIHRLASHLHRLTRQPPNTVVKLLKSVNQSLNSVLVSPCLPFQIKNLPICCVVPNVVCMARVLRIA